MSFNNIEPIKLYQNQNKKRESLQGPFEGVPLETYEMAPTFKPLKPKSIRAKVNAWENSNPGGSSTTAGGNVATGQPSSHAAQGSAVGSNSTAGGNSGTGQPTSGNADTSTAPVSGGGGSTTGGGLRTNQPSSQDANSIGPMSKLLAELNSPPQKKSSPAVDNTGLDQRSSMDRTTSEPFTPSVLRNTGIGQPTAVEGDKFSALGVDLSIPGLGSGVNSAPAQQQKDNTGSGEASDNLEIGQSSSLDNNTSEEVQPARWKGKGRAQDTPIVPASGQHSVPQSSAFEDEDEYVFDYFDQEAEDEYQRECLRTEQGYYDKPVTSSAGPADEPAEMDEMEKPLFLIDDEMQRALWADIYNQDNPDPFNNAYNEMDDEPEDKPANESAEMDDEQRAMLADDEERAFYTDLLNRGVSDPFSYAFNKREGEPEHEPVHQPANEPANEPAERDDMHSWERAYQAVFGQQDNEAADEPANEPEMMELDDGDRDMLGEIDQASGESEDEEEAEQSYREYDEMVYQQDAEERTAEEYDYNEIVDRPEAALAEPFFGAAGEDMMEENLFETSHPMYPRADLPESIIASREDETMEELHSEFPYGETPGQQPVQPAPVADPPREFDTSIAFEATEEPHSEYPDGETPSRRLLMQAKELRVKYKLLAAVMLLPHFARLPESSIREAADYARQASDLATEFQVSGPLQARCAYYIGFADAVLSKKDGRPLRPTSMSSPLDARRAKEMTPLDYFEVACDAKGVYDEGLLAVEWVNYLSKADPSPAASKKASTTKSWTGRLS